MQDPAALVFLTYAISAALVPVEVWIIPCLWDKLKERLRP